MSRISQFVMLVCDLVNKVSGFVESGACSPWDEREAPVSPHAGGLDLDSDSMQKFQRFKELAAPLCTIPSELDFSESGHQYEAGDVYQRIRCMV